MSALEMYLILYPKELEEEVIELLEAAGVPGYTEMPKMIGRGRRVKHFDNPVWPGATGALFTVLEPEEARRDLVPRFKTLAADARDTRQATGCTGCTCSRSVSS